MKNHDPQNPRSADPKNKAHNMHDDVTAMDDEVCCCEPEPRWQTVADEQRDADRKAASDRESERETNA